MRGSENTSMVGNQVKDLSLTLNCLNKNYTLARDQRLPLIGDFLLIVWHQNKVTNIKYFYTQTDFNSSKILYRMNVRDVLEEVDFWNEITRLFHKKSRMERLSNCCNFEMKKQKYEEYVSFSVQTYGVQNIKERKTSKIKLQWAYGCSGSMDVGKVVSLPGMNE